MCSMLSRLFIRHEEPRRRVRSAACSEQGLVRRDNQDNFFAQDSRLTYCVADGMGGGDGGAQASEIVRKQIAAAIEPLSGGEYAERIRAADDAIKRANTEIREYAEKMRYRAMATTATVLLFDDDPENNEAVVGYVGDSRVYRWRAGNLLQVTRDHTMAEELGRFARLGLAPELKSRSCRLSHVLTRAVGIEPELNMDWKRVDVVPGDWFLVCSDGVYDMVDAEGIAASFAAGGAPEDVVKDLTMKIVLNGACDNYTMIVARVEEDR